MLEHFRRRVAHPDDDDTPAAAARPLPGWIALSATAALIALVAFASRSGIVASGAIPIDFKPAFTAIRALAYVGMALGLLALPVVVVYRARARRARAQRSANERQLEPVPLWLRALGIAVLVAMFAFQIAVVLAFIDNVRRAVTGASGGGVAGVDPSAFGHATDDATALVLALVIVVALAVGIVIVAIRWRVLESPTGVDAAGGRAAVTRAVDLSLDALRGEPDPRRAVIAAYAAMERSLSGAGLGRHRHEAPLEYLRRVLDGPTPVAEDVREITLLFQHAKFSHHAVEEAMRSRAIEALARIRAAFGGDR